MDIDEIVELIDENHRLLIIVGGVICFIASFLPFWSINAIFTTVSPSLSSSWMFWVFLILLIGLFAGLFLEFGEKYHYMFLVIGIVLFIITLAASQIGSGNEYSALISLAIGFYLELIGAIIIAIGGYYYYNEHNY